MIRVLIVDDSVSVRELLFRLISEQKDMEIVGMAATGAEALNMVRKLKPDVVTMDISLPDMDGFKVTRRIMEEFPLPIVIISSVASPLDSDSGFRALDSGALTLMDKPRLNDPCFDKNMNEIIHTLRLMSEVKVVRRRVKKDKADDIIINNQISREYQPSSNRGTYKVICIGVSTGGPQALKKILTSLPESFSIPILIVQHMSKGFLDGMITWLDSMTPLKVKVADSGEKVQGGTVYFAPEEMHMHINTDLKISFSKTKTSDGIMPSVGELFSSAARNIGADAVGVIMTGMGRDGAAGLLEMREAGAYTIAQDKESSIVFGMPGEAVKLGAAGKVFSLDAITFELLNFVSDKK